MKELSPAEFKFVSELLSGSTVEQAGEAVGIKRRAATEWKAKEHIQAALEAGREGQEKVIEEYRANRVRATIPAISQKLQDNVIDAIDQIVNLMKNGGRDDTVKFQAAKYLIQISGVIESQQTTKGVERSIKQKGLSPEDAAKIRSEILGIKTVEVEVNRDKINGMQSQTIYEEDYGDTAESNNDRAQGDNSSGVVAVLDPSPGGQATGGTAGQRTSDQSIY